MMSSVPPSYEEATGNIPPTNISPDLTKPNVTTTHSDDVSKREATGTNNTAQQDVMNQPIVEPPTVTRQEQTRPTFGHKRVYVVCPYCGIGCKSRTTRDSRTNWKQWTGAICCLCCWLGTCILLLINHNSNASPPANCGSCFFPSCDDSSSTSRTRHYCRNCDKYLGQSPAQ